MTALSPVDHQVFWHRLIAIAEEQAQTLIRAGFSPSTREAGDVSNGFFDRRGRMIAQAVTGTPGHVNAMAAAVPHFLARFPLDTMRAGDAYITNDPWMATGHLNDFTVVSPCFHEGRAVGLFASTCHVVDVGGLGNTADGRQVYEEGLNVPISKIVDGGRRVENLFDIIAWNVRDPVPVLGDIQALIACNEVGNRRMSSLLAEMGLADIEVEADRIVDASREAMSRALRGLRPGTYRNTLTMDGYDRPVTLCATMTIGDGEVHIDLTGSSAVSTFGINVPLSYTRAYCSFAVACVCGSEIPRNHGSLEVIHVGAPDGTIVNAPRPSAVSARHVIGLMLPDLILGCLDGAVEGGVLAESSSSLWSLLLLGGSGRFHVPHTDMSGATPFQLLTFHSGGMGARPTKDGLSATCFPSGVRNMALEISEMISPVIFWRKELRPDSGGAGRFRGGLGQIMEVGSLEDYPFAVDAMLDRVHNPARGRQGGQAGAAGIVRLASGKLLNGKGRQVIPAGDRLVVEMPGGGGVGPVEERAPEAVASDLANGFVTGGDDPAVDARSDDAAEKILRRAI